MPLPSLLSATLTEVAQTQHVETANIILKILEKGVLIDNNTLGIL